MEANQYTTKAERLEHQLSYSKTRDRDTVAISISDLEFLMRVARQTWTSAEEAKPPK